MTETEFLKLDDPETRAEWVSGRAFPLPWPNIAHAELNLWLLAILRQFVEHYDLGRVFGPNIVVRSTKPRARRLPDVKVLLKARCRLVREYHIEGAPDLIIEIVSAQTQSRDRREKYLEYEKAGVREYWIVDPISEQLEAYVLKRGKYVEMEPEKEIWRSTVLNGFYLKSSWLWRVPLPKLVTIARELGVI